MNLLMINATWHPTGGDWTYIESVCKIYESKGINIIPFSMKHESNFETPYDKYFVENVDYKELNINKTLKKGLNVLARSIYSVDAQHKLRLLLSENKVDIAQLNNIHNIQTPSIIPILKKRGIPTVWRVLDYKLICPNRTFLSNDTICEACFNNKFYNCILKKCKKQSVLASMVASLESYIYSFLPYYKQVDQFLFQSEFSRDQFIKYGLDPAKAVIIENPYDCESIIPNFNLNKENKYVLYFGRISKEKGLFTLYDAMKLIPNIKLKIVGDGPDFNDSITYLVQNNIYNIEFVGAKWGEELTPFINNCEFVVVPSEWYEPSPYVILQSFSFGKPVIASDIGGLKDMIINNFNGQLVKVKDSNDLSISINNLYCNQDKIITLGKNARGYLESKYNSTNYYNKSINLFNRMLYNTNNL